MKKEIKNREKATIEEAMSDFVPVRGVIYDNQDRLFLHASKIGECAADAIKRKDVIAERLDNFKNNGMTNAPSFDELFASVIMNSMLNPEPGHKNFIIPSEMVDPCLREDLEKIDMGKYIMPAFMYSCVSEEEELNKEIDRMIEEENKNNKKHGIKIRFSDENGCIAECRYDNLKDAKNGIFHQMMNGEIDKEVGKEVIKLLNSKGEF